MAKNFDLTGRVALVTGASSGIGRAVALTLAESGAKVVVAARRTDKLFDLVKEIEAKGGKAMAVSADVEKEETLIAAYNDAETKFGPVDTVIANAGINMDGWATQLTVEQLHTLMNVNVTGAFLTAREGARRMMKNVEKGRGRVVLVASMGGLRALPGLAAYCTSKAAVVMMAQALALEWAKYEINVNAVCPGYILTEINKDWFESEHGKKHIQTLPRKRLMALEDLQAAIAYFSSDSCRATTGSVLAISDAQHLA